jgi:hypothetical protein
VKDDTGTGTEVSNGPSKYKIIVEGFGRIASLILGMAIVEN